MADVGLANSILRPKHPQRDATCRIPSTHSDYISISEMSSRVPLATGNGLRMGSAAMPRPSSRSASSLRDHVVNIIRLAAEEEMCRANTARIVTGVQNFHTTRDGTEVQLPRQTMSLHRVASVYDGGVAITRACVSKEVLTSLRPLDTRPEPPHVRGACARSTSTRKTTTGVWLLGIVSGAIGPPKRLAADGTKEVDRGRLGSHGKSPSLCRAPRRATVVGASCSPLYTNGEAQ